MTDVREWIKERRHIHSTADLRAECESNDGVVSTVWSGLGDWSGPIDDREHIADSCPEGGEAIADALSALPVVLDALDAVLDDHQPTSTGVGDETWSEPDYCQKCAVYSPCPTWQRVHDIVNGITRGDNLEHVH